MKLRILFVSILLSGSVFGQVNEGQELPAKKLVLIKDDQGMTYYYDNASRVTNGAVITVDVVSNLKPPLTNNNRTKSFVTSHSLDCKLETFQFLNGKTFTKTFGKGEIIANMNNSNKTIGIEPNTLGEVLLVDMCAKEYEPKNLDSREYIPKEKLLNTSKEFTSALLDRQKNVVITVWVNESGLPYYSSVIFSSGDSKLDETGKKIVMGYKFEPYLVNGKPVKLRTNTNIVFNNDKN